MGYLEVLQSRHLLCQTVKSIILLIRTMILVLHNPRQYKDNKHIILYTDNLRKTKKAIHVHLYIHVYCKSGNFHENFIFANSVKRHICDVKNRV